MQRTSDYIIFKTDEGEEVRFFIIEETMLAGKNYLLVSDGTGEDAVAYIMQEVTEEDDEKVYEIVNDDKEIEAISKVFQELLDSVELKL